MKDTDKTFPEVDQKMKEEIIETHRKLEALSSGHTLRQQRRFDKKPESKWGKNYFKKKAQ